MSGQYPGYNSPLGGGSGGHHRGQFNPQQQMVNSMPMNQMGSNQMGMAQNLGVPQQVGNMMSGGYGGQMVGQMMQQQQQPNPMQAVGGMPNMSMGPGGVGIMGAVGLQSPSHIQQQQLMQQQMQMQQQMGGPQMNIMGTASGMMPQQQQPMVGGQMGGNTSQQTASTTGNMQHQLPSGIPTQAQTNSMLAISQPNPHKEINIVALSRLGQETVQDITSRFQEIFAALKIIQPTANRDNNTEKKVQEYFRTIRLLFKRVRIIYEKCNDGYPQGMEYTHVESLIPYLDVPDHRIETTQCEEYRKAVQDNQELIETVKLKNRQLREIIDRTRIIIWEINTMLSMRRS